MKKQQIEVLGCLVKDHKILLLKNRDEYGDDTGVQEITLPGGSVQFSEDPHDSLMRHYMDQTGLVVEPFVPFRVLNRESEDEQTHIVTIAFLVEPTDMDDIEIVAGDDEYEIIWADSETITTYELAEELEMVILMALELSHGETDNGLVQ